MSRPPELNAPENVAADEPFTYSTPARSLPIVNTTWCQLFIEYVLDELTVVRV